MGKVVKPRRRRAKQGVFELKSWGGPRAGSGPKPEGARAGVSHRQRAALASRYPVHVTLRLRAGLASMRRMPARRAIERVFAAARERFDTRLVHYTIQSNHLHLIVESRERGALSRALQGLAVRLARALNKIGERKGSIFADRYHDRILRTPREVRNALLYVLRNHARHGIRLTGFDPFASAQRFDGWRESKCVAEIPLHLSLAKTWLLEVGWKQRGLLSSSEMPRGAR